jgi:hypothetical protein
MTSVYYCPRERFLAFNSSDNLVYSGTGAISLIEKFINENRGEYIISAFSYDLKNQFESLTSRNEDISCFPDVLLWIPEIIVEFQDDGYRVVKGSLTIDDHSFIEKFII